MEPNKERIAEWVAALRSGEFQQTTGQLKDEKGYCCLGVACELAGRRQWVNGRWSESGVFFKADNEKDAQEAVLPDFVRRAYGLSAANPNVDFEPLADRNDFGQSFEDLADLIEKEYLQ